MPRPAKPIRLWKRKARRDAEGRVVAKATWIILDHGQHIPTGCSESDVEGANECLAAYIAEKHQPIRKTRAIDAIAIAEVLTIYVKDVGPKATLPKRFAARIERLSEYWGNKTLADINDAECMAYCRKRGNTGGARRDLEDLRAAIGHHAKAGYHREIVTVKLPPKGPPRTRWLTRKEAALLLWTAWTHRETQNGKPTRKRPLRHLARFILIGLYTGTRAGAIAAASPKEIEGRSFVDLENGIFYRLAIGKMPTKKTQTPVRLPTRLLAHMRRWHERGIAKEHFVEFAGEPVKIVKTGFARLQTLTGLRGVTPHTLRHTAATWLMHNRVSKWDAADFLGMSEAMIEKVYGHHDPEHQRDTAEAIGYRKRQPVSLVISLAEARKKREKPKEIGLFDAPEEARS